MVEAFAWGFLAGSSLLLGGFLALRRPIGLHVLGLVMAFAGGALLTMLADTMMPEAFGYGGKQVGLVTTLGFALAFFISTLEPG